MDELLYKEMCVWNEEVCRTTMHSMVLINTLFFYFWVIVLLLFLAVRFILKSHKFTISFFSKQ